MKLLAIGLLVTNALLGSLAYAEAWRPIVEPDLSIVAESALDFSALVETGPAGKHGRIIAGPDGHLAFNDSPTQAQRFFCASQPYGVLFPDHDTIDQYARQLRLHGYNAARFHFVDNHLMAGRKADFDFNPEQLDRFYYFMAALKREGIYWVLDGVSSWNGAYGDVEDRDKPEKHDVKLGIYFSETERKHWHQLVSQLLASKNPYTKLAPLKDPALLGVILVNEGGLNHAVNQAAGPLVLDTVNKAFAPWVLKKYPSLDAISDAWGIPLAVNDDIKVMRKNWDNPTHARDTQLFYYETQVAALQWMTQSMRKLGYKGLLTAYDNWPNLQDSATRAHLPWVDMHAYDDEPSAWISAGSRLKQQSSLVGNLQYVRDLAISRYWSKPFTVSEYDQPFWSQWRFESGLAVGAYASLQHWDLICRHAFGPIELAYGKTDASQRKAIHPFGIGMDPVARANETLAALLYLRKDVQTAKHAIDIRLSKEYVFDEQHGIGRLSSKLSKLALLTGVGVTWEQSKRAADLTIVPEDNRPTAAKKAVDILGQWIGLGSKDWSELLGELKQHGILTADNLSNSEDILQSDTGEIVLDNAAKTLRVETPKTEAVTFADNLPPALAHLKITAAGSPGLLAVSALDAGDLSTSKRLLLIYATDARNSGMSFADAQAEELKEFGTLPVLMKAGQISFELKHDNPQGLKLYALHLNGARAEQLPLAIKDKQLMEVNLNLSNLQHPTTYFELVGE